ncbi:hypothetical protein CEXT_378041, partial [Caerostris extrusa]
ERGVGVGQKASPGSAAPSSTSRCPTHLAWTALIDSSHWRNKLEKEADNQFHWELCDDERKRAAFLRKSPSFLLSPRRTNSLGESSASWL